MCIPLYCIDMVFREFLTEIFSPNKEIEKQIDTLEGEIEKADLNTQKYSKMMDKYEKEFKNLVEDAKSSEGEIERRRLMKAKQIKQEYDQVRQDYIESVSNLVANAYILIEKEWLAEHGYSKLEEVEPSEVEDNTGDFITKLDQKLNPREYENQMNISHDALQEYRNQDTDDEINLNLDSSESLTPSRTVSDFSDGFRVKIIKESIGEKLFTELFG